MIRAMARMVLVHGAFGRASVWDRVAPGLRAAGHDVETLDLPGQGEDDTPVAEVTMDRYARRVGEVLADGPPAVLVGHSMGGVVVTQAAAQAPEHIDRLIYVAAFVPADGESLIDLTQRPEGAGDAVQSGLVVDGDPPVATMPPDAAREGLMHCCDEESAAWAQSLRGSQPVAPFTHPVRLTDSDGFARLPRAYVMCLQDRAIRPALQRFMLERAGCDPVLEIDTDHCVWASRPGELVSALDRLASS